MSRSVGLVRKLVYAIEDADVDMGLRIVEEWMDNRGADMLMSFLLEPSLKMIGERWNTKQISLAQSFVASKVAEEAIRLYEEREGASTGPSEAEGKDKRIVLGNMEGDCHHLGKKMVSTILRSRGWRITDVGVDVEAGVFIDKALEVGAPIIGISAMVYQAAMNIRKVRDEMERRRVSDRLALVVGGAIFRINPGLADEVGADAFAQDALKAAAVIDALHEKTVESGRAP